MQITLSTMVKVRVTTDGMRVIEAQNERRRNHTPTIPAIIVPPADGQGRSIWPLWKLFEVFGRHVYDGQRPPFHREMEVISNA